MYKGFFDNSIAEKRMQIQFQPNDLYRHLIEGRQKFPTFKEVIELESKMIELGGLVVKDIAENERGNIRF